MKKERIHYKSISVWLVIIFSCSITSTPGDNFDGETWLYRKDSVYYFSNISGGVIKAGRTYKSSFKDTVLFGYIIGDYNHHRSLRDSVEIKVVRDRSSEEIPFFIGEYDTTTWKVGRMWFYPDTANRRNGTIRFLPGSVSILWIGDESFMFEFVVCRDLLRKANSFTFYLPENDMNILYGIVSKEHFFSNPGVHRIGW